MAQTLSQKHTRDNSIRKRQKRRQKATWLSQPVESGSILSTCQKTPFAYNCWCRQSNILFIQLCLHVMKWLFKLMRTVIDVITVYTSDLADVSLSLSLSRMHTDTHTHTIKIGKLYKNRRLPKKYCKTNTIKYIYIFFYR